MPRCLIVDDHEDGRDGFQEYLESHGFIVDATATAEDALRLAEDHAFDVMIVDLQLPGMNGWDYIQTVRRGSRLWDVPIIAVSACVFPEDRARAEAAGCDVFLAKPCGPDELLVEVRRLLEAARTRAS
jgi:two-component system, cell cycle response regulator DivK